MPSLFLESLNINHLKILYH